MSREYKFRAWDEEERRFWYFTLQEILERRMSYRGSWDEKVLRGKKQQYIGLKDKNGNEIYEGDILHRDCYWDVYIVWDDKKSQFSVLCTDWIVTQGRTASISEEWSKHYEIIGNIYEKPELLSK